MEISVTESTPETPAAEPVAVVVTPAPEPDGAAVQLAQTVGELVAKVDALSAELPSVRSQAELADSSARLALERVGQLETEPAPEPETAAAITEVAAEVTEPAPDSGSVVAPASRRSWWVELFL